MRAKKERLLRIHLNANIFHNRVTLPLTTCLPGIEMPWLKNRDTTARKPANATAVPEASPGAQVSRSSPPSGVLQPLGAQSCATLPPHSQTADDGTASTSEPLTMNPGSQSYAAYNSESHPNPHQPQSLAITLLPHNASLAGEPASMSQYIGSSQQYMSALQLAPNYALPSPWQFLPRTSLLQCESNKSNSAGDSNKLWMSCVYVSRYIYIYIYPCVWYIYVAVAGLTSSATAGAVTSTAHGFCGGYGIIVAVVYPPHGKCLLIICQ